MAKLKWPLLTTAEIMTLSALSKLGEVHNVDIFEAIQAVYPEANFPTIYTALVRMTWKGYVSARQGPPQPTRGGRSRKFYKITAKGQQVLASTEQALSAVRQLRVHAKA